MTQTLSVMQAMMMFMLLSMLSMMQAYCDRDYPQEIDDQEAWWPSTPVSWPAKIRSGRSLSDP